MRNITSRKDEARYEGEMIAEEDFSFKFRDDEKITLDNRTYELHIVIHIPKPIKSQKGINQPEKFLSDIK